MLRSARVGQYNDPAGTGGGWAEGDPTVRKYMGYAVGAFLFYLMVQFPDDAIRLLSNSRDLLGRIAEQSSEFVRGTFGT